MSILGRHAAAERAAAMNASTFDRVPVLAAGVALVTLLLFFLARNLTHYIFSGGDAFRIWVILGLCAAFGLAFIFVRYRDIPTFMSPLTRFSAIGSAIYLIVEPPNFTLANPDAAPLADIFIYAYWPCVVAGILSIWRPSLSILPAVFILASRDVVVYISGFRLSTLDIQYMMEMVIFLAAMGSIIGALGPRIKESFRNEYAKCLAFAAIGLHLANYFWSGIAKLVLGPYPWTWALENVTPNSMLVAMDRGVLPSVMHPEITQTLYQSFMLTYPISNTFVFLAQLVAIIAVLRIFWLKLASLAYDALHIGIWLLGGLFFWPWVWNNVTILLAIQGQKDKEIGYAPKITCIVVILMGIFPQLGGAAWLAWWDVPEIKHGRFEARLSENDPWVAVPISYWNSHSYAISHGYHDLVPAEGHYPPEIWGSSTDYTRNVVAGTCPDPSGFESVRPEETPERKADRLARIEAFVTAHHAKMRDAQNDFPGLMGVPAFYLRSHHHPSIPWAHEAFNALDLDDVSQYRIVTQSLCLSLENGELQRHLVHETEVMIDVR